MYINLTNNHNIVLNEESHFLSPFLLTYDEAAGSEIESICEEYPYEDLSPGIVRAVSDGIYEKTWNALSTALNTYNNVDFSMLFWKIYGSYDFHFFINMYYERYIEIKKVLSKYQSLVFLISDRLDDYYIALSSERKKPIASDFDLISMIDWQILGYFKIYPCIIKNSETLSRDESRDNRNIVDYLKLFTKRLYNVFFASSHSSNRIACADMGFAYKYLKYLPKRYRGKLFFPFIIKSNPCTNKIDYSFREDVLKDINFDVKNEFEEIFFSFLYKNLFCSFVESFTGILKNSNFVLRTKPKAISICGRDCNRLMCAGLVREMNGIIIDVAHSMPESFMNPSYCKTKEYFDYYLDWSCSSLFWNGRCRYFGNSRLNINRYEPIDYLRNDEILYICADPFLAFITREEVACVRENWSFVKCSKDPGLFYENLESRLLSKVFYRIRDDFGRELKTYISKFVSLSQIEDMNTRGHSLLDRMKKARVIVCETINSSTFFEAILLGIPTLVIDGGGGKEYYHAGMHELYNKLMRMGVIIEDGKSAACVINEYYDKTSLLWSKYEQNDIINELFPNANNQDNSWFYGFIDELLNRLAI